MSFLIIAINPKLDSTHFILLFWRAMISHDPLRLTWEQVKFHLFWSTAVTDEVTSKILHRWIPLSLKTTLNTLKGRIITGILLRESHIFRRWHHYRERRGMSTITAASSRVRQQKEMGSCSKNDNVISCKNDWTMKLFVKWLRS